MVAEFERFGIDSENFNSMLKAKLVTWSNNCFFRLGQNEIYIHRIITMYQQSLVFENNDGRINGVIRIIFEYDFRAVGSHL